MRKNVIALMLVLPLLFIFVLFTAVNVTGLGVVISANGIEIKNKPDGGAFYIDLASPAGESIVAEVQPANASNKDYSFIIENLGDSPRADISVSSSGAITASSVGSAKVIAESKDGRFRDSVNVIVGSTKPYDFDFALHSDDNNADIVFEGGSAEVNSGRFTMSARIYPVGFTAFDVSLSGDSVDYPALIDNGAGKITLPFSGEVGLDVTVENGVNGAIKKSFTLDVKKPYTPSGITVNGSSGDVITLKKGAKSAEFYVECDEEPQIRQSDRFVSTVSALGENRYKITLEISREVAEEDFSAEIISGAQTQTVDFSYADFDFTLRSDLAFVKDSHGSDTCTALMGSVVRFYVVPTVNADNVTYEWGVDGAQIPHTAESDKCTLEIPEDIKSAATVWVQAYVDGKPSGESKQVKVTFIRNVSSINIGFKTDLGLAGSYALAGRCIAADGSLKTNSIDIGAEVKSMGATLEDWSGDVDITVSDERLIKAELQENKLYLTPKGTNAGTVKVLLEWKGNRTFGASVRASVTLDVVPEAVEVTTSAQLFKYAADGRYPIILGKDIKLASDPADETKPLPDGEIKSLYKTMQSTYNTQFYKNTGRESSVRYCLEFKNDLYGNGYSVDAGFMTYVSTDLKSEYIFSGPLSLVEFGDIASVAAQDNIAFLVRTDGVKLYNVTLLGCSDECLRDDTKPEEELLYLTKLEEVGTTLEINADADIINCRIRNGRNVVRAYGGNSSGDNYFVDSPEGLGDISESDRIKVNIEGCILSQAREFILKVGANRALHVSNEVMSPDLTDISGNAYKAQTNDYLNDDYFYSHYVMTDVTLKDSVFETSGLFAIGVESNFSGEMLSYNPVFGGDLVSTWNGVGGTSFASVLRLVGDVRIYDWKGLDYVNSSTLIKVNEKAGINWLTLNIGEMLNCAVAQDSEKYGDIIYREEEEQYVHGGIAFYGGGKNYSQIDFGGLDQPLGDYKQYNINISILANSEDSDLKNQGTLLPHAAGESDFRFYLLHGKDSYLRQQTDEQEGAKYTGVSALPAFS